MILYIFLLVIPLAAIAWHRFKRYILVNFTALADIQQAGVPRKTNERIPGRAVIVGGSITGLCVARVLSDHFETVSIIEAEDVSTDPAIRRTRLQQWDQIHAFLPILRKGLQRLFPSFEEECINSGVIFAKPLPLAALYRFGGFLRSVPIDQCPADWISLSMGRETFETTLRKLVKQDCPNVQTIHATATGMLMSSTGGNVQEIEYRQPSGSTNSMPCSLLVDASGPAQVGLKWLRKLGYAMPDESDYTPYLRYTTWDWTLTPATIDRLNAEAGLPVSFEELGNLGASFDQGDGCDATIFQNIGQGVVRGGAITVDGADNAPKTLEELHIMTASHAHLPWSRKMMGMIWDAYEAEHEGILHTPRTVNLGACYNVKFLARDLPRNYIPAGDATLRLNPVFGQGCSKALIDALTLDHVFRKHIQEPSLPENLVAQFLPLHASRLNGMFDMTKIMDYANAVTKPVKGEQHSLGNFTRKFQWFIFQASFRDPSGKLGAHLLKVLTMLDTPLIMFDPLFLVKCVWAFYTGPAPEYS